MLGPASALGTPCARALTADDLDPDVRDALSHLPVDAAPVSAYVLRPDRAAARAAALRAALPSWAVLLFAVKANAHPAVLDALAAPGGVDGFEVASREEARLAAAALAPGAPIAAAGPAKHPRLLLDLLEAGASVVHAESTTELHRVDAVARALGRPVPVAVRVNPRRVDVTGTLAMGGRATAFGVAERDVPDALALARSLPGVDVVGFHVHAVSGNRDARAHAAYVRQVLDWSAVTATAHRVDLRWVDVGGGLGVSYDGSAPLDLEVLAEELDRVVPPAGVEVAFEPGRWLAADCGWYAAEVVDLKDVHGTTFAVVRGGIGGFALPATEDFPFPVAVLPVERWDEHFPRPEKAGAILTVAGELCTPEDVLVRDVHVDRVRVGDLLVLPLAGAYGREFALRDFLGHPPPAQLVVNGHAPVPSAPARPESS